MSALAIATTPVPRACDPQTTFHRLVKESLHNSLLRRRHDLFQIDLGMRERNGPQGLARPQTAVLELISLLLTTFAGNENSARRRVHTIVSQSQFVRRATWAKEDR
jgi:hypothetical protein